MLIVMAGLPGTGKSTLARKLADSLRAGGAGVTILDKDVVRVALFGPDYIEYSTEQDDLCVDVMLRAAEYILSKAPCKHGVPCRHVVLDGRSFSRRYQVAVVRGFARQLGVPCAWIECVCSDETVRERLERDVAEGRHLAANRNYEMYLSVKARAEPIEGPKLVVDTENEPERCVQRCLDYLAVHGRSSPCS